MNPLFWCVAKFMETKAWEWLSGKVLSRIHLRFWGEPAFKLDPGLLELHAAIRAWQEAGNCGVLAFATADHSSLTGKLVLLATRGQFSHAGLLVAPAKFEEFKAMHMTASGLHWEHPMQAFSNEDEIKVVAFPMSRENAAQARARIGCFLALRDVIRYDFEQRLGNDRRIYCSELVLMAVQDLTDDPHAVPSTILDRKGFSPDAVAACGVTIFERRKQR